MHSDHRILASIIREEIDAYRAPENEAQEMRLSTALDIARSFARMSQTCEQEFLQACGIDESVRHA